MSKPTEIPQTSFYSSWRERNRHNEDNVRMRADLRSNGYWGVDHEDVTQGTLMTFMAQGGTLVEAVAEVLGEELNTELYDDYCEEHDLINSEVGYFLEYCIGDYAQEITQLKPLHKDKVPENSTHVLNVFQELTQQEKNSVIDAILLSNRIS